MKWKYFAYLKDAELVRLREWQIREHYSTEKRAQNDRNAQLCLCSLQFHCSLSALVLICKVINHCVCREVELSFTKNFFCYLTQTLVNIIKKQWRKFFCSAHSLQQTVQFLSMSWFNCIGNTVKTYRL